MKKKIINNYIKLLKAMKFPENKLQEILIKYQGNDNELESVLADTEYKWTSIYLNDDDEELHHINYVFDDKEHRDRVNECMDGIEKIIEREGI